MLQGHRNICVASINMDIGCQSYYFFLFSLFLPLASHLPPDAIFFFSQSETNMLQKVCLHIFIGCLNVTVVVSCCLS